MFIDQQVINSRSMEGTQLVMEYVYGTPCKYQSKWASRLALNLFTSWGFSIDWILNTLEIEQC